MRRCCGWLPILPSAALVLLTLVGCGGGGGAPEGPAGVSAAELRPVPAPDLSAADPAVREQLEGQLRAAWESLATADADPAETATRFGELGLSYILYDFLEAAEACFLNARALAPEDFRWTYLLGYLRQTQGRLPEAVPLFEDAFGLGPDYLPTSLRLGRARLELGETEAARRHFERALELDPASAAAHEGLGRVAAAGGDDRAAVEHFERALEVEPEASGIRYALGQSYRRLGDLDRARAALEQSGDVPARIPDPLINPLAGQAESEQFFQMQGAEALEDRDHEAAAGAFTAALEKNPQSFPGYRGLALAMERMGDLAGARATLEKGLREATTGDPDRDRWEKAGLYRLLGGVATLEGRDREVLESFAASLELLPDQAALHLRLGNALARAGRFEEAVRHFDRFLELEPDLAAVAYEKRATALVNLGRKQEAVADFERAVEAAPRSPVLRLRFAAALEFLGEKVAAERQRREAERLGDEGAGRLWVLLEEAHRQVEQGAFEEAVARYREALELAPGSLEAGYGLASVLGHLGRYEEAIPRFGAVLEAEPRHTAARHGLAAALILAGRYGEARMHLQESLRLFPRDEELALVQVRLLATVPDPRVRDGELALEIARRIYAEDRGPEARAAMALALAAAGRFDEAARLQRELIAAAQQERGADAAAPLLARLAAFEAGRAWTAESPEAILASAAARRAR